MDGALEPTQEELLERQRGRESNARSYPRRLPVALAWGSGCIVRDVAGREYIDCLAGAGALALGHSHPAVTEALQRTLAEQVPLSTLDLPTPRRDRFTTTLLDALPAELANGRIQFCSPSGADAVEAAIKLCRIATGRRPVIAFGGSYHGMTSGGMALSGAHGSRAAAGVFGDVHHLPFPARYRSPFGIEGEHSAHIAGNVLRWALTDDHSGITRPAAILMEPVQGEGGVHPAPDEFVRDVRLQATLADVPLVLDEVQTGLGRTGTLWGFDSSGIVPDVVVLSKAIGGGLPLAVIVYREPMDLWPAGAHAGTFRGSQLALAAGEAAIRTVVAEGLAEHAAQVGAQLREALHSAAGGDPRVGEVRGRGLMLGVELVDPDVLDPYGRPSPDGPLARAVQHEMLARGVIVEVGGRGGAVVRFLPPLILSSVQGEHVADVFGLALAATRARAGVSD